MPKFKTPHRTTSLQIDFIQTTRAKRPLLMLNKQMYAMSTASKRYWHCIKRSTNNCHARLRFDDAFNLVFYEFKHSHPPPPYWKTSDGKYTFTPVPKVQNDLPFELIEPGPNRKRAKLLLQGYVYCQTTTGRRYWHCSKRAQLKCRARLRFDEKFTMTFSYLEHTHEPPLNIKTEEDIKLEVEEGALYPHVEVHENGAVHHDFPHSEVVEIGLEPPILPEYEFIIPHLPPKRSVRKKK